ncbi:MAG: Flp family type IVb pilin [Candidatus Syntrophonatronum acetioxidans]|uniref:Flp family type IVb pilin n=1 Tax=Candidatus Syntrophonatronum acetioxidans TaxID=1795816 RepID=A0A424YAG6_9FIRM|nr:MAG: Flp family type IVb pilin [Candidatus Syntrophonatronum acetioxidans]
MDLVKKLWTDEEGQGLTEYALILGTIAIVVYVILTNIGGLLEGIYTRVEDSLGDI